MAAIFKITVTRKLTPTAEIVVRQGKQFVRKKRNGRVTLLPIASGGKTYHEESRKWYIQYRNANGVKQRVAGYTDKDATAQLAAELERKAEYIQSGLSDPHENGKLLPLKSHLTEFGESLKGASNSAKHVDQTCNRIERLMDGCGFSTWTEIVPSSVVKWLASERAAGRMGIKTSNYYLAALKQFCTWLEIDGKVPKDRNPVEHLSAINADTDIRWERRAISPEEFARLVASAESAPDIQRVSGPDRAMLYILAAWTGYRRQELASLSKKSFDLDGRPATVRVKAGYSKRRRNDVVPLHPAVATRLKAWLEAKDTDRDEPVFNLRARAGGIRRTAKMMRLDLDRARKAWIEESPDPRTRANRDQSDFLKYQNEAGMYADFHANRHTFITNLALAGVHPKMAQSIARHSDVNLTMGIYSHVDVAQQSAAINSLAAPPVSIVSTPTDNSTGSETESSNQEVAASGSEKSVAPIVAPTFGFECLCMASAVTSEDDHAADVRKQKPLPEQGLVAICHHLAQGDLSSGGGIRTPDTRIMIPLL